MLIATFLTILEQEVNKQHVAGTARNVSVVTLNLVTAWNLPSTAKAVLQLHLVFFHSETDSCTSTNHPKFPLLSRERSKHLVEHNLFHLMYMSEVRQKSDT